MVPTSLIGPAEPTYPSDDWQRLYMRRLADRLARWKRLYYYGTPEIDDATFDLHWRNLLHLEARYPHLADPASPTRSVGAPLPSPRRTT